jgi:4'-phosphopantetheinyl transferase EntD
MTSNLSLKYKKTLDSLFPSQIKLVLTQQTPELHLLEPGERELVENFTAKKQAEFAAGRQCARQALAYFGIKNHAILKDETGRPIWPEGFTGSISHCQGMYGAAVCKSSACKSLGFDVELIPRKIHEHEVLKRICLPEELDEISGLSGSNFKVIARLIFSAKESAFKCLSCLNHGQMGYKSIHIRLAREKGTFSAQFALSHDCESPVPECPGRYLVIGEYVFTGCWIAA